MGYDHYRECTRCGHRWWARKKEPKRCSKCRSPYWNQPRRDDLPSPEELEKMTEEELHRSVSNFL